MSGEVTNTGAALGSGTTISQWWPGGQAPDQLGAGLLLVLLRGVVGRRHLSWCPTERPASETGSRRRSTSRRRRSTSSLASSGGTRYNTLGLGAPLWPVLARPPMAGFEMSTGANRRSRRPGAVSGQCAASDWDDSAHPSEPGRAPLLALLQGQAPD